MDALTEHRKKRLQQLIAGKPYNGERSLFLKAVGLTKGRLSQILDSEEAFGELSAMRIARKLKLADERYFERGAPGAPLVWPFHMITPDQIRSLTPANLQIVQNVTQDLLNAQPLPIVSDLPKSETVVPRTLKSGLHQLDTLKDDIAKRVPVKEEKPSRRRGRGAS